MPDQDGVFVLDTFQGTPELVELVPAELGLRGKSRHGLAVLNPMAGEKAEIDLDGEHAKVHLHIDDPTIYLSLDSPSDAEPVTTHAMTVQTAAPRKPLTTSMELIRRLQDSPSFMWTNEGLSASLAPSM